MLTASLVLPVQDLFPLVTWHGSESDGTTLTEVAMGHVNVCTGISHTSGECGSRVVHWF